MDRHQNKVILIGTYGGDEAHAASGWCSTGGMTEERKQRIPEFLKMLATSGHGTPFEKSMLHFSVTADTASHIHLLKHRIGVCLAEDTEIWTETISESGRTIRRRHIGTLWQNWYIGVKDKPHRRIGRTKNLSEEISGRVRLLPSCRYQSLRVLNESDDLFQLGHIEDVISAGMKEVVELVVDGRSLRCTPQHRIFTQNGWVPAGDLMRYDAIATVGIVGVGDGPMVPKRLREGIGIWTEKQRSKLIRKYDFCYKCNEEFLFSELELDHVIPVYKDLEKALLISNLLPICKICHKKKTAGEQVQQTRTAAGAKYLPLLVTPKVVAEVATFDLTVSGAYNNFVANGIVVHNSVNAESARYRELKEDKLYVPQDWPIAEQEAYLQWCIDAQKQYHRVLCRLEPVLGRKRAKESARFYLPYGNQLTLDTSFNFRSFQHFLGLRWTEHAQLEIREIAGKMLELVREIDGFKHSLAAFDY